MTDQSHPAPRPAGTNTAGTTGFVLSLVLLVFTCGFLCPISLVVSFVGLKKEPRGLALAGVIVSGAGVLLAVAVIAFGASIWRLVEDMQEKVELQSAAEQTLAEGEGVIRAHEVAAGMAPGDIEGNALLREAGLADPWDNELRYEVREDAWRVLSAGPDRELGTLDDELGRWRTR